MPLTFLKPIRVIISLLFFLLTIFIFVDFASLAPVWLFRALLYMQFIPSFIEFIGLFTWASAGFLFVFLLTWLFGRVFCSTICPLGTLQDIFIRITTWFRRKKQFRYLKTGRALPFIILGVAFFVFFFRNIIVFNLFDPFSISGKIFSNIAGPVYTGANNGLSRSLKLFDNYTFYLVPLKHFSWISFGISVLLLGTIGYLAITRIRWYCNMICPVGTMLGLVSRISAFRIDIDEKACTTCGLCVKECKGGCIDFRNHKIDFDRCVACFNCFGSCPEKGITYRFALSGKQSRVKVSSQTALTSHFASVSRRRFFKTLMAGSASVAGLVVSAKATKADEKTSSTHPVTPPGSISFWNFTQNCTACHLCVSVCPTSVIRPGFLDYGITGLLQPKMDFHASFCNFDCVRCSQVCPSGAILPVTKEEKQRIQTGVSVFVKNICIVVEKKTACGACSEHCPTKAVEMVPYLDNLKIPQVDAKICVGCGACEYACPTKPEKAIYVESNLYHRRAQKPLKKVGETKVTKPAEDFPF
jgi:ferredoxin